MLLVAQALHLRQALSGVHPHQEGDLATRHVNCAPCAAECAVGSHCLQVVHFAVGEGIGVLWH